MQLSCYGKFNAVGVVRFFVSAKVVGGARLTVVMSVEVPQSVKPTKRLKEDTVRQRRGKELIVRLKTAAGRD